MILRRFKTQYQNNQGVREIASTTCLSQRQLVLMIYGTLVIFDAGKWLRRFRVRLQNKYDFVSVGLERWAP